MKDSPALLWKPTADFIAHSRMEHFRKWMEERLDQPFQDYAALWKYSVDYIEDFWQAIADYFDVLFHDKPQSILGGSHMPRAEWFEGSTLNYAEHIFRNFSQERPAIIFQSEQCPMREISWAEMRDQVSRLRSYFKSAGVHTGDAVVGFMPNIPEATYAFLAANSLGAVWSGCSPDFGVGSVVERFSQINPKVLIAADGYRYNGKPYRKLEVVREIAARIPSIEKIIIVPFLDEPVDLSGYDKTFLYSEVVGITSELLEFTPVPFSHPIWVLYSSGTTGDPKAITHSHGGVLLEHLKYLALQNDVHPGERFFWFSTTGWMMWNFVQASLLVGATVVLYDGSPGYPDLNVLWKYAETAGISHFGTSAPYIVACMKKGLEPGKAFDLKAMRSIGSTGSPLPPAGFRWIYEAVREDVWLCSMSGGTDVCTAFIGGCPVLPVYEGEIQSRALGCSLHAFNEDGQPVRDEIGEMVITKPMPSMPVYFWGDPDGQRYESSYFDYFPGVWRHGDWIRITDRDGIVIYGRSDATLNRQGVRIGTAEIYRAVHLIPEIEDAIVVNIERQDGSHFMPLFVVLKEHTELTESIKDQIRDSLKSAYTPRHVPDAIYRCPGIPLTISGKKMEAPLKRILIGMDPAKAINRDAMRNPEVVDFYLDFYKKHLAGRPG